MKPNSATLSTDHYVDAGKVTAERAGQTSFAVLAALALIRAYKLLISPLFVGSCRFLPSCSDYAAEAIRRHLRA